MALPYFGESQPGDTYYFTPLNIYNHGVVDASDEHDRLYCHTYQEGDGKKGGYKVASLVMKTLGTDTLCWGKLVEGQTYAGQTPSGYQLLKMWVSRASASLTMKVPSHPPQHHSRSHSYTLICISVVS
jgi:hypothetical protein